MIKHLFLDKKEQEIIKGCLAGNPVCQKELYKRFASKMLAVCFRYAKNREEAEDTLQEGFMIVFQKLDQYKGEGSFEGWVRRIMVNKSIERFRKKSSVHLLVDIDAAENDYLRADEILSSLAAKDLLSMIQELPPVYRMVFNLYVFEGMKHKEIAQRLGIVEGTSKSNLSDARKLLKEKIKQSTIVAKAKNA